MIAAVAAICVTAPALADDAVLCVQRELAGLGYAPGPADGLMGQRTAAAAGQFATDTLAQLPALSQGTAAQWCDAVADFAAGPAAALLSEPIADLVPNDVLINFAASDPADRARLCRVQASGIDALASLAPTPKIEGFTSRMAGDHDRVPGARDAERFAAIFAAQSAAAFAAEDGERKGRLLDALTRWAEAGAFLDTISCVRSNGDLVTTGQCTEWTVPDGSDPSGMKDATFATFLAAGIVRAYVIALADFEPETRADQHAAIAAWTESIGGRLKRPTSVYFGLNMGWYWPGIVDDYAGGRPADARAKLERLLAGIDPLIHLDGSIEDRTTRGDRAIWYHYTSLGEIVISLEFMRAAGISIPAALEERLHRAVALFLDAVEDPATIEPWAREAHNARAGIQDWDFTGWPDAEFAGSWLHVYPYRYPQREEAQRLRALVAPSARSATTDTDFGFGLGCLYNAARGPVATKPPASPAGPALRVGHAAVSLGFADERTNIYSVRISAVTLNGTPVVVPGFDVFNDFSDATDNLGNLELFRIGFMREDLADPESRAADYRQCGDLAVSERDGGRQQLRLHLGRESGRNACILGKMADSDAALWSTLLDHLDVVLDAASGDAARALREVHDFLAP